MRPAPTALLASAALALLLSACGIPSTGVVESGAPATGVQSPTLIYFVKNDDLIPVPRKADPGADVVTAVQMLLKGPNDDERGAGVTTAMLPLKFSPKIWNTGAKVFILLPPGTRPIINIALRQLVCTAAHALHTQDPDARSVQVTVTYPSGDSAVWQAAASSGGCSLPAAAGVSSRPGTA